MPSGLSGTKFQSLGKKRKEKKKKKIHSTMSDLRVGWSFNSRKRCPAPSSLIPVPSETINPKKKNERKKNYC
jgi:hypothetical protein